VTVVARAIARRLLTGDVEAEELATDTADRVTRFLKRSAETAGESESGAHPSTWSGSALAVLLLPAIERSYRRRMPRPRKQTELDATIATIVARAAREIADAVRRSIAQSIGLTLGATSPRPAATAPATTAPTVPLKRKRKRNLTPEGRKRLSDMMKARWAKRRAAKSK
jgi:hypothetical protein